MRFEKDKAIHEKVGAEFLKSLNNSFFTPLVIKGIIEHHNREKYQINYDEKITNKLIQILKTADSYDSTQRKEEKDKKPTHEPSNQSLTEQLQKQRVISFFHYSKQTEKMENIDYKELDKFPLQFFSGKTFGIKDKDHGYRYIKERLKEADYKNVLNSALKNKSFENAMNNSLVWLREFTFFIPASTHEGENKSSLFEHSKNVAAISQALTEGNPEKPVLLILGQFKGIQNFIKTQSFKSEDQKGYTKRSRGRSFFIQILTELTIQLLLKRLNLTRASIVMSAGGHFYLIAPNTTQNKQIIETTYCEINEFLISNTDKLNFTLESVEADKNSFKPENLQELLATINKKAELKKFERLFNEKMYENIFEKEFEGKECKSCGFKEISYKNKDLCEMCSLAENIGQIYNENKLYLITGTQKNQSNIIIELLKKRPFNDLGDISLVTDNKNNIKEFFPNKGFVYCFANYQHITEEYSKKRKLFSYELLKEIEKFDISIDFGFKPSTKPLNKQNKKTLELEEIAKINENKTTKLSHLRIDVDNLGKIIQKAKTISQISTISSQLLLFFGKKISEVIDNDTTYTVFIGGDDLYILSRCDIMFPQTEKIVKEFQNFYNERLTVSGGLNIFHHAFPMNVAIEITENEITKAKNYSNEKNSISFLDKQVKWNDWFEILEFAQKLKSSNISTNQIYKIMKLLEKNQNKSRKLHVFYYILGRLKENKNEEELKIIKEFENKVLESTMNNTDDTYTKKIILIIKIVLMLRRIDTEKGVEAT